MLDYMSVLERVDTSDLIVRESGENTLIQLPDGRVAGLNAISKFLLQQCDGKRNVQAVCDSMFEQLLDKDNLDKNIVLAESMDAMNSLADLGLVRILQPVAERESQ